MGPLRIGRAREPGGRGLPSVRVRCERCPEVPAAPAAEYPSAESGCHRNPGPEAAWVLQRAVRAAEHPHCAACPIAESDYGRSGLRAAMAAPSGLPRAAEAAAPSELPRGVQAAEPARGPGLPARRSFAHWSHLMSDQANADRAGRHTPAKLRASGPQRWSEVWQSYRSPEQQFCHRTHHIFLEKVTYRTVSLPGLSTGRVPVRGRLGT